MKKIVVLISGQGRNLQAILDACADRRIDGQVVAVISDRADAAGLGKAAVAQVVPWAQSKNREEFCRSLAAALEVHRPDLVACAGFMRVLTPEFTRQFEGRLLNIHPSLLPRHRGLHTHRAALAAGDKDHGASVHFVTAELDGGPLIIQGCIPVRSGDTEATLAERVMNEVELKIYPQVLAWLARGVLRCNAGVIQFNGQPLKQALTLDDLEPAFR